MFEKISKKIGFTQTEIKVILFLVITFLIGYGIKFYKDNSIEPNKSYDYSTEDSLFNYYKENAKKNLEAEKQKEITKFDSKAKVLGLKPEEFTEKKNLPPLEEKSIDINSADLETLIRLPGIGEITAQRIIDLRAEKGKFDSLDELMDVKGIGKSKFSKIEKFLYINPTF